MLEQEIKEIFLDSLGAAFQVPVFSKNMYANLEDVKYVIDSSSKLAANKLDERYHLKVDFHLTGVDVWFNDSLYLTPDSYIFYYFTAGESRLLGYCVFDDSQPVFAPEWMTYSEFLEQILDRL